MLFVVQLPCPVRFLCRGQLSLAPSLLSAMPTFPHTVGNNPSPSGIRLTIVACGVQRYMLFHPFHPFPALEGSKKFHLFHNVTMGGLSAATRRLRLATNSIRLLLSDTKMPEYFVYYRFCHSFSCQRHQCLCCLI